MDKILVSGLINFETAVKVEAFPVPYFPVCYPFNQVKSTVSGVGFNIAKALTILGDSVRFLSIIGQDNLGIVVKATLEADHIPLPDVLSLIEQTPQSVILYDSQGKREIHVDLKDIQEQSYPLEIFRSALAECSLAVLCNINFTRPFLSEARRSGVLLATDVHAISSLDDDYNRDYMKTANILFMSDESLPCSPEEWARQVLNRYGTDILVVGMGAQGVLLAVRQDHFMERLSPIYTRPVVNTIGAGDALFSAFLHAYQKNHDPYNSIRKALVFASYKIGASGGAEGFLTEKELEVYETIS